MARLLALAFAALLLGVSTAEAAKTRVVTVGPRFDLSWVDSRENYVDKLDGMMATIPRTGRDLVVLPEDIGLMAAFTGTRGVAARAVTADTGGLVAALATLFGTYSTVLPYYGGKYPELLGRGLPTRQLAVSLTDTFGRVAVETYAALADKYDVYLEAGVNMARDWRIVCTSKATFAPLPGGVGCDEENPGLVTLLRSPDEPLRGYAYEATTSEPVNMALVFGPDGKLLSKQVKAYLTPVELPGQLDLEPGDVSGLGVVKTPVGRLGFVTSKDAWMPDVTAKLDAAGVEILVQPEFFVGDTVRTTGMWSPDNLKASGYSALLRHPSIKALALPELTGDVFDFSADAQSHIAVKPSPGGPRGGMVGQRPVPGFAAVQRWLAPDPVELPLDERRAQLGAAGEAAVRSNTQQEGVLWYDVEVGVRPKVRRVARERDRPLSPSRSAQRNAALAVKGGQVFAAFEEAGRIRVRSGPPGGPKQHSVVLGKGQWPSISANSRRIYAAWQQGKRVVYSTSRDGKRWTAPAPLDATTEARQWRPSIAATKRGAYAAWIADEKSGAHVYGARPGKKPERLDEGTPVELAEQLDNSWAPDVAANKNEVLVTWTDFRAYKWDVYSRLSTDGGTTFDSQQRVNDTPEERESINDTPKAAFLAGDPFPVWTDFRATDNPAEHPLYNILGGDNRQLDTDGKRQLNAFAPAVTPLSKGRLAIAWQSHRGSTADVQARVIRRDGSPGKAVLIGDRQRSNAWRPAIVRLKGDRVFLAWEDDRDGPTNIFGSVRVLPSAKSP